LLIPDNNGRDKYKKKNLLVIPETRANIGKYISGINNAKKNDYKKINVKSHSCIIDDEAIIFLYTCKDVKAGQELFLDYNQGGGPSAVYDTSYFQ
jgi:uncharacterized protein YdbL (DUF1318 family)